MNLQTQRANETLDQCNESISGAFSSNTNMKMQIIKPLKPEAKNRLKAPGLGTPR
jgi:hypothetical protein